MAKSSSQVGYGSSALELLQKPDAIALKPVYVLHGDEEFLRLGALAAIRARVLGTDGNELGARQFEGKTAALADVLDELSLLPFFGSRRLVVVSNADEFVSAHRDALERFVQQPSRSGVLVLCVQSWPSNTRLFKFVNQSGLAIDCRSPAPHQLAPWCRRWASDRYGKRLAADAADLLVELASGGLGMLDQEINKLCCYVGECAEITAADVDKLVAAGRVETVWKIIDAAASGDTVSALRMLQALLSAGEQPIAVFGAISSHLRRLAKAHRLVAQGESVRSALPKAGIQFYTDKAQAQLRYLGPGRLMRLYRWLLETDLGMKGDSMLPPDHLLERLVVRLADHPATKTPGVSFRQA
jgi:DNA polymerase-3 subunit delta